MEKPPGGGSAVFRSERSEHQVAWRAETNRQRLVEEIYAKLQAEFEKRAAGPGKKRESTLNYRESLRNGHVRNVNLL